jgi:hypothetical protein
MNKSLTLTAAAVLALAFGGASAATIQKSVSGKMAKPFVGGFAGMVLYDQSGSDSGVAILSQNFESAFDAYDSTGADDFTVPAGMTWKVSAVNATGAYFNGSGLAVSEHVTIYKDKGGKPSAVVADFPGLMGKDNGTGSFSIKLPSTVKLKAGTYWISVQVDMDYGVGGEWGWENQTVVAGTAPMWINPGNGFQSGCTKWMNEATCVGQPGALGDHIFTLMGK